nr:immunoglobulin heavy chain junction region [Macaca mulatta]MOV53366.1 immunoglobulin heavy chain junction region [Macaca mulatta]MOV53436.1 immunoglobulin heavy chain junction region [Macaca mulatta]MOV53596.1 immunoglobulin heavy chain junction region [Macaca mulatta]MOV53798.1 immunoglobulin heavy chain junction region [Macaca mulatta]
CARAPLEQWVQFDYW